MATLERAILIATEAHSGQKDKAGAPYILHPLRMMMQMKSETEMIAAVLHDVLEDTSVTWEDLRDRGFSPEILDAVDALTRRADESYPAFIDRAKCNPIARAVKIADLEDNMNLRRLEQLAEKEIERLTRYHQAWLDLTTT